MVLSTRAGCIYPYIPIHTYVLHCIIYCDYFIVRVCIVCVTYSTLSLSWSAPGGMDRPSHLDYFVSAITAIYIFLALSIIHPVMWQIATCAKMALHNLHFTPCTLASKVFFVLFCCYCMSVDCKLLYCFNCCILLQSARGENRIELWIGINFGHLLLEAFHVGSILHSQLATCFI